MKLPRVVLIAVVAVIAACIVGVSTGVIFPETDITWKEVVAVIVLLPIVSFLLWAAARSAKMTDEED